MAFSFVILSIWICITACHAEADRQNNVLFDFENDAELDLFTWKCRSRFSLSDEYKSNGQKSLKFEFFPANQVGFSTDQIEHDWSHVQAFQFWSFNPSNENYSIFLRISDDATDGECLISFEKRIEIGPGENFVSIPLSELKDAYSRKLKVSYIKGFYIYMKDIKSKATLYFDEFSVSRLGV